MAKQRHKEKTVSGAVAKERISGSKREPPAHPNSHKPLYRKDGSKSARKQAVSVNGKSEQQAPPPLPLLPTGPIPYTLNTTVERLEKLHCPLRREHLQFELMLFLYLVVHLLIQNYNIYRLNFYNYNLYLLCLTMIIFAKRLVIKYFRYIRRENPLELSFPQICLNLLLISVIAVNSLYLTVQLFLRHPLRNFLFLFYPSLLYWFLFRTCTWCGESQPKELRVVDYFKRMLYNSIEACYYAGFLPLRFLQHDYIYFDPVRCALVVVYVLVNSLVMLFSYALSTSFNELYVQTQQLGCWRTQPHCTAQSLPATSSPVTCTAEPPRWSRECAPYRKDAVVMHNGQCYVAMATSNAAEPGRWLPLLLYHMFSRPERTYRLLICLQGLVVLSQMALLLGASSAHGWAVYAAMLAFNYYILYRCIAAKRVNRAVLKLLAESAMSTSTPPPPPLDGLANGSTGVGTPMKSSEPLTAMSRADTAATASTRTPGATVLTNHDQRQHHRHPSHYSRHRTVDERPGRG